MKPLSNSYWSSKAWKLVCSEGESKLVYDYKVTLYGNLSVAVLFCVVGLSSFFIADEELSLMILISCMSFACMMGLIAMTFADNQKKAAPFFIYSADSDMLNVCGLGRRVESAKQTVSFSYEFHPGSSGLYNTELNVVIDGKRFGLLSSRGVSTSIEKVIAELRVLGFNTVEWRHPDLKI